MRAQRLVGWLLIALGGIVASVALLGPLVAGVIRYRTSATTLNQIIGGDVAALALVAPACIAAGICALFGHRAAVVALAPTAFVLYTYVQLVVGQEYLRLPGNNERFFPLFYAGFVLAAVVFIVIWGGRAVDLPSPSVRLRRVAAAALLAVAFFLLLQHLPSLVDAWRQVPQRTEYVSSPTPFWLVKLMDLGIVIPAAVAAAIGLLQASPWATRAMYAIVGAYALLGASVVGMAITMYAHDDPDASIATVVGFTALAGVFLALAIAVYRPLWRRDAVVTRPR
jgi:hypothetical protein